MPKYLLQASYRAKGAKGLLKDGGTKRRSAIQALVKEAGGKLEAFYFAFGDEDVYVIADVPDNETAVAISLSVAASGFVEIKTIVLLTAEQVDEAAKKTVEYKAPGE